MSEKSLENLTEEVVEKENNYGRNVEVDAIFVRHGEKATSTQSAETGLTEEGEEMSKVFGSGLSAKDAIKAYSSDTDRTRDTVRIATEASPTGKKLKLRVKGDLGMIYDEKGPLIKELFGIKRSRLGENFKNLSPDEQSKRLKNYEAEATNLYLNYCEARPDAGTQSPLETAATVARRVDTFIRMAGRLHSGSKVDLLNGSHDWVLASFLKEVLVRGLNGKKIRGFKNIEEVGGPIGFTENFNVKIRTDAEGKKTVKIAFRGKDYELDQERLAELVAIAKKLT